MFNRSGLGSRTFSTIRTIFAVFATLFLVQSTFAQTQATTGNIHGRVCDPDGAAISGVTVIARNDDTGFSRSALSDQDGEYVFILLTPGTYTVSASAVPGFAQIKIGQIVLMV